VKIGETIIIGGELFVQNGFGCHRAAFDRHRRLDHLIILLLDQVPSNRARKGPRQVRIISGGSFVGQIQALVPERFNRGISRTVPSR